MLQVLSWPVNGGSRHGLLSLQPYTQGWFSSTSADRART